MSIEREEKDKLIYFVNIGEKQSVKDLKKFTSITGVHDNLKDRFEVIYIEYERKFEQIIIYWFDPSPTIHRIIFVAHDEGPQDTNPKRSNWGSVI